MLQLLQKASNIGKKIIEISKMQEKQEMGLKAESSFFKGEFWSYMLFVLPPQASHCPADVSGHGGLLCISRDSE